MNKENEIDFWIKNMYKENSKKKRKNTLRAEEEKVMYKSLKNFNEVIDARLKRGDFLINKNSISKTEIFFHELWNKSKGKVLVKFTKDVEEWDSEDEKVEKQPNKVQYGTVSRSSFMEIMKLFLQKSSEWKNKINGVNLDSDKFRECTREKTKSIQVILKDEWFESELGMSADVQKRYGFNLKTTDRKSVAFFPYRNNSKIDLTRYQIYGSSKKENMANAEKHCLLYCLKKLGIADASINHLERNLSFGQYITKTDLREKVPQAIKKKLVLHYFRKNGEKGMKKHCEIHGKEYSDEIHLAMHSNHIFLYDAKTDWNLQAIKKNYKKYLHEALQNGELSLEKAKTFDRIDRGKLKFNFNKKNNNKASSLQIVHYLHQQGFFEEGTSLTNSLLESAKCTNLDKKNTVTISLDEISGDQKPFKLKKKKKKGEVIILRSIFYADTEAVVQGDSSNKKKGGGRNGKKHRLLMMQACSNERMSNETDEENGLLPPILVECNSSNSRREAIKKFFDGMLQRSVKENDGDKQKGCVRYEIIVYFHNLKYDFKLMEQDLVEMGKVKQICIRDQNYYSISLTHGSDVQFTFKDSYKLLTTRLSEFPSIFNLPAKLRKMEAIAYKFYNEEIMKYECHSIEEYKNCLVSNEEKETFQKIFSDENNQELFNYKNGHFNAKKYYMHYLKFDILVLRAGIQKFQKLLQEQISNKINLHDSLTITSLTRKFLISQGCFEGTYENSKNLRDFIQQAIRGGRCDVNKNYALQVLKGPIADFDANSLYPSAIYRMCADGRGAPLGPAKKIEDWDNVWGYDHFVVKIKITKVNKKQNVPFISYKDEKTGGIVWTNEPPPHDIVVGRITLEDYIRFQEIEYEMLEGVYWNKGFNTKYGECIRVMYDGRSKWKQKKKSGNPLGEPMQNILKFMMNSSYGKTITKKQRSKVVYVRRTKGKRDKETGQWVKGEKDQHLFNHVDYNWTQLKSIRLFPTMACFEHFYIDTSYNQNHIGEMILAYSKRIFFEVLDVANDLQAPIFYTDTDSIHLYEKDVSRIEKKFEEKYLSKEFNEYKTPCGKNTFKVKKPPKITSLIGKDMGQFSIDFDDITFRDGRKVEPRAIRSIFLAKKVYIDVLEATHPVTKEKKRSYHVRAKGIPPRSLMHHAKKIYKDAGEDAIFKMFQDVAKGKSMEVILNPNEELFSIRYDHSGPKTMKSGCLKRTIRPGSSRCNKDETNRKKRKTQESTYSNITSFKSFEKAYMHEMEQEQMEEENKNK